MLSHPSPGEDEAEQLQCMMEVLNVPSKGLIDQSTRRKLFFDSDDAPRITANSHGKLRIPGTASRRGFGYEFSDIVPWCHGANQLCMVISYFWSHQSPRICIMLIVFRFQVTGASAKMHRRVLPRSPPEVFPLGSGATHHPGSGTVTPLDYRTDAPAAPVTPQPATSDERLPSWQQSLNARE